MVNRLQAKATQQLISGDGPDAVKGLALAISRGAVDAGCDADMIRTLNTHLKASSPPGRSRHDNSFLPRPCGLFSIAGHGMQGSGVQHGRIGSLHLRQHHQSGVHLDRHGEAVRQSNQRSDLTRSAAAYSTRSPISPGGGFASTRSAGSSTWYRPPAPS